MAMWSSRTSGYKLAVLAFFLGAAFYLIGYASPYWLAFQGSSSGLWMGCYESYGRTKCISTTGNEVGWFKAVQAMQSLGLIGLFIAGLFAIVVNCCQTTASHNRFLEIMAACSGIAGFIGCMIFVGKMDEAMSSYYGWAFGLDLTGCCLVILAAVIIFATNRADLTGTTATGGAVLSQGGTTMVMQGQMYPPPGQAYPAQPGVGYVAQPGYGPPPQGYSGGAYYPGAAQVPPHMPSAPPAYSAYGYNQGYSGVGANPEQK